MHYDIQHLPVHFPVHRGLNHIREMPDEITLNYYIPDYCCFPLPVFCNVEIQFVMPGF